MATNSGGTCRDISGCALPTKSVELIVVMYSVALVGTRNVTPTGLNISIMYNNYKWGLSRKVNYTCTMHVAKPSPQFL